MKLRGLLFGAAIFAGLMASAAPLTPEAALERLGNMGPKRLAASSQTLPKLKMTLKSADNQPSLYVFDNADNQGYLIVSADDAITPILGFSDSGTFDAENMAPGLAYWLGEYNRQIEYARSEGASTLNGPLKVSLPSSWTAIAPLVKTNWNQSTPYNNLCPESNGTRCYTGCVATSMSQIMKYWNYPQVGSGSISYTCSSLGNKRLQIRFSDITFDYDNMLDRYVTGQYSTEEATAVATLMQAAGYAVQMEYSTGTSGAVSGRIPQALVEYFGFDKGVCYLDRSDYIYNDWAALLYDNLEKGQPVIYDGLAPDGGHSFIIDGYNGSGYFHINWGWGGSSDGYFLLDALNPSSIGIGGADGGFNYDQDAVLNIKPASEDSTSEVQEEMYLYGTLGAKVINGNLRFYTFDGLYAGFAYQGIGKTNFKIGAAFTDYNNPDSEPVYIEDTYYGTFTAVPATYIPVSEADVSQGPSIPLSRITLETGVPYKVTVCYKQELGAWEPMPADIGSYNYVILTKNGDGNYNIEIKEPMQFSVTGLSLESALYANNAVEVKASLINNNDTELSRGVQLRLIDGDGNMAFDGDCEFMTLAPGESGSKEWISSLTAARGVNVTRDTEYFLGLYDPETTVTYYVSSEPVVMKPSPGVPKYSVKVTVDGAESTTDRNGNTIYTVTNGNNFDVTTALTIEEGYFSSQITMHIMYQSGNYLYSMLSFPYNLAFIEAGETKSFTVNCNFPDAELNKTYYLGPSSVVNGSLQWLTNTGYIDTAIKVTGFDGPKEDDDTGIGELFADSSEILFIRDKAAGTLSVMGGIDGISDVKAFSVNGSRLPLKVSMANGQAYLNLRNLGKGVIILQATDKAGNVKSVKVAL